MLATKEAREMLQNVLLHLTEYLEVSGLKAKVTNRKNLKVRILSPEHRASIIPDSKGISIYRDGELCNNWSYEQLNNRSQGPSWFLAQYIVGLHWTGEL